MKRSKRLMPTAAEQHIGACDSYLNNRTGKYAWRRVRYLRALTAMQAVGLDHSHTVLDVGAGFTELDYCLRADGQWRGRYVPVDGSIDGTDLDQWTPPRDADFFVALELLEHLHNPARLVAAMQKRCRLGIVISTPNPLTTDVLGMDATHMTPIFADDLNRWGFQHIEPISFYGKPDDSLFAVWIAA